MPDGGESPEERQALVNLDNAIKEYTKARGEGDTGEWVRNWYLIVDAMLEDEPDATSTFIVVPDPTPTIHTQLGMVQYASIRLAHYVAQDGEV